MRSKGYCWKRGKEGGRRLCTIQIDTSGRSGERGEKEIEDEGEMEGENEGEEDHVNSGGT